MAEEVIAPVVRRALVLVAAPGAMLWSETLAYTPSATVYVRDPVF